MEIEIIDEQTTYVQKVKTYTLMYRDFQVEVRKFWNDDSSYGDEDDWEIINIEEVKEELSDDEQDELVSFIMTLI